MLATPGTASAIYFGSRAYAHHRLLTKGAPQTHAHRIRQRPVHRAAGRAHPQPHRPVRRQALPGVRRQALRRLPCLARAARLRARLQDPHAARASSTTPRSSSPSTPNDIEKSKVRGDLGITYDEDVLRLMDIFRGMGFAVGGVVITHYTNQPVGRRVPQAPGQPGHPQLPALPHPRLPLRHRPHRERRGLWHATSSSRPRGRSWW